MLAAQSQRVDLDADLEEEEDDADVGQHLQLVPIRDVPGCERRHDQPGGKVADNRRQSEAASQPAGPHGKEKDHPYLEHRGCGLERGEGIERHDQIMQGEGTRPWRPVSVKLCDSTGA